MPAPNVFKRPPRKSYYTSIRGKVVSTGQTDQRMALQVASKMSQVGIEAYRKGKRTLGEYLPDLIEKYLEYLRDKDGRDELHIKKKRSKLMKPVEEGVFSKLKDVRKQTFEPWWSELPCGAKTRKEYMSAWNVFLDWLVYEDKLDKNPIRGLIRPARDSKSNERKRRAFTLDECSRFLSVAGVHELLYLTALGTGARFGELKQLTWNDVHELDEQPRIVLRPETTKNRKGRTQSISAELASMLKAARNPANTERLFQAMPSRHTVDKHFKLAEIPKHTDDGVACFHGLRHTYTTIIARMTKDTRLTQRMADHADITTTQRYLHIQRSEEVEVMAEFPNMRTAERAVKRAVGPIQTGQSESNDGPVKSIVERRQVSGNELVRLAESGLVQSSQLMEPGGIEPPCRDCQ